MFGIKKQLDRIEAKINAIEAKLNDKSNSFTGQDEQNNVSFNQIMNEWLNGAKGDGI